MLKKVTAHNQQENPLVKVEPFKKKHLEGVQMMHLAHHYASMYLITMEELPKIGFVVHATNDNDYAAAGFLRMVEGGYCQIDTVVSNPNLSNDIRHLALQLLQKTLIDKAKSLKLKAIICFTADKGVFKRAEDTGFQVLDHRVVTLSLS